MNISCVVLDDNQQSLNVLEDSIKSFQQIDLVGKFSTSLQLFDFLIDHKIDFVFMSFGFKNSFGQQALSKFKHKPLLVMIETGDENAFEGFNATNADYVLNSIDYADFLQAISTMYQLKSHQSSDK
jgi:DNA-binding NarL/FixJ family response regulator